MIFWNFWWIFQIFDDFLKFLMIFQIFDEFLIFLTSFQHFFHIRNDKKDERSSLKIFHWLKSEKRAREATVQHHITGLVPTPIQTCTIERHITANKWISRRFGLNRVHFSYANSQSHHCGPSPVPLKPLISGTLSWQFIQT